MAEMKRQPQLARSIDRWRNSLPRAMATEQSPAAIELLHAQRAELLALCQRFSAMYGSLWDSADHEGCGWLSEQSVEKYDTIHDDMKAAIARATGATQ